MSAQGAGYDFMTLDFGGSPLAASLSGTSSTVHGTFPQGFASFAATTDPSPGPSGYTIQPTADPGQVQVSPTGQAAPDCNDPNLSGQPCKDCCKKSPLSWVPGYCAGWDWECDHKIGDPTKGLGGLLGGILPKFDTDSLVTRLVLAVAGLLVLAVGFYLVAQHTTLAITRDAA